MGKKRVAKFAAFVNFVGSRQMDNADFVFFDQFNLGIGQMNGVRQNNPGTGQPQINQRFHRPAAINPDAFLNPALGFRRMHPQ